MSTPLLRTGFRQLSTNYLHTEWLISLFLSGFRWCREASGRETEAPRSQRAFGLGCNALLMQFCGLSGSLQKRNQSTQKPTCRCSHLVFGSVGRLLATPDTAGRFRRLTGRVMSHLQEIQGQAKAGVLVGTKRRHCGTARYSGISSHEISEGSHSRCEELSEQLL